MSLNTLWKWSKSLILRFKTISCTVLKAIFRPKQIVVTVVAFLIFGLLYNFFFIIHNIKDINPVTGPIEDFHTTDILLKIMVGGETSHNICDDIVIVDITELYDHDSIAIVLEKIDSIGPSAIDVDIVFERPMDCDGDAHLREVAGKLKNAVITYWLRDYDKDQNKFTKQTHSYFAKDLTLNEGFVNINRQGTVREVPLTIEMGEDTYHSVIARMMEIIGLDSSDQEICRINYKPTEFRTIRYDSVQNYADFIENKIVFLGSADGIGDICYTPLGPRSGVEVLCYAMKTMSETNKLTDCPKIPFWLLTILISYIGVCCVMRYKDKTLNMKEGMMRDLLCTTLVTSIFIFFLMVAYIAIAFWFFYVRQFYFNLTPTLSVIALATTSRDFVIILIKQRKTCFYACKLKSLFKLNKKGNTK